MRVWTGIVALGLVGCFGGMSEDKFAEKYALESCELLFDCLDQVDTSSTFGTFMFFDDVESCANLVEASVYLSNDNCDYDAKAASDCVDSLKGVTCDPEDAMTFTQSPDPSCTAVYSGESCQWMSYGTYTYSTDSSWSTYSTSTTP